MRGQAAGVTGLSKFNFSGKKNGDGEGVIELKEEDIPESMADALKQARNQIGSFVRSAMTGRVSLQEKQVLSQINQTVSSITTALSAYLVSPKTEGEIEDDYDALVLDALTTHISNSYVPIYSGIVFKKVTGYESMTFLNSLQSLASYLEQLKKLTLNKIKAGESKEAETLKNDEEKTSREMLAFEERLTKLEEQKTELSSEVEKLASDNQEFKQDLAKETLAREKAESDSEKYRLLLDNIIGKLSGGSASVMALTDGSEAGLSTQIDEMLNDFAAKKRRESEFEYLSGYELPEDFKRGCSLEDWKHKYGSDLKTYDKIKLIMVMSTRRYLAVTHLLTYLDNFVTSTGSAVAASDSAYYKRLAMIFIFHIIMSPTLAWEQIKEDIQYEFIQAQAKHKNWSVLGETLLAIDKLYATDADMKTHDANLQDIAATVYSLFDKTRIGTRSSGLLVRLDNQEFLTEKLISISDGERLPVRGSEPGISYFIDNPSHTAAATYGFNG